MRSIDCHRLGLPMGAAIGMAAALLTTACGRPQVVPLLASAGVPLTQTPAASVPLEIVTRSTSVRDPLRVDGARVAYADFEAALGHAVSSAAVPWADKNQGRREGGWQLFVEVVQAEAEHDGDRLVVTIAVRATLRARQGGNHIAQTETACRDAALVPAEKGAAVLFACMTRIGRDLTAWLALAEPERPAASAAAAPARDLGGAVGASGSYADKDGDGEPDDSDGDDDGDGDGDAD